MSSSNRCLALMNRRTALLCTASLFWLDICLAAEAGPVVTGNMAAHQLPADAPIAGQLSLDGGHIEGAYYVNSMWVMPQGAALREWQREPAQVHPFLSTIAFLGSDLDNPEQLGGEVEIWLDNEKHVIRNSSLVFIPAGLRYGPITYRQLTQPIRELRIAATPHYELRPAPPSEANTITVTDRANSRYGYLIYDKMNPRYEGLDPSVATNNLINREVEGANYFDSGLIKQNPPNAEHGIVYGYRGTHRHNEGETFFFLGVDPSQPRQLGAEIEVMVGGETYRITEPALVYVPANTTHVPISYRSMSADVFEAMTGPLPHADWGYQPEPNSGPPGVIYTHGVQFFGPNPEAFMNQEDN